MGPKIIFDPQQFRGKTGIHRVNGGWQVVIRGRLAGSYYGAGSKRRAISKAGTNVVLV